MSPSFATILVTGGVATLFYLDRNPKIKTSRALWLAVIWVWIIGSRPVTAWLGITPASMSASQAAEGSPIDAAIFGILTLSALVVLARRRRLKPILIASWPILLYFGYCLLSVTWSDFSGIASKRWIKSLGDLAMALVVATDLDPPAALQRLIARVGLILMPYSWLLIKYFNDLGRGYDPDGHPMNIGVATEKNSLGVIALVIAMGAMWRVISLLKGEPIRNRKYALWARVLLLFMSLVILAMAKSATSIACFALGTVLELGICSAIVRRRPARVHLLVGGIVLCGGILFLLGDTSSVFHLLGRGSNLTGRTSIWAAVLSVASNPVLGAGFESFWLGPRLGEVYAHLSRFMHVNEAHNGYIEVYLNLGIIGVVLISMVLISAYRGAVMVVPRRPELGALLVAYAVVPAIYSFTEAGFRLLDPIWMFLLLSALMSRSLSMSRRAAPAPSSVLRDSTPAWASINIPVGQGQTSISHRTQ